MAQKVIWDMTYCRLPHLSLRLESSKHVSHLARSQHKHFPLLSHRWLATLHISEGWSDQLELVVGHFMASSTSKKNKLGESHGHHSLQKNIEEENTCRGRAGRCQNLVLINCKFIRVRSTQTCTQRVKYVRFLLCGSSLKKFSTELWMELALNSWV